jgi:hypothetical protein
MITSALIYSVRFGPKLALPEAIQASITKLRLVPATYRPSRPVRPQKYVSRKREDGNWRTKVIADYVRKVRETDDPQYDEMFGIFNKVAAQTMDKLSAEAITIMKARDEQFRLRVTTLLFDKAIKGSAYAGVMADLAKRMNNEISDVSEDLEVHVQMFGTLYDMSGTLTFPKLDEPDFEDKVVAWAKQKDVRRGYARFLTHLYSRELVSGQALQESMQKVIQDLNDTLVQPKSEQSEENVTQFADFLFEIAKLLKPTAIELRGLILSSVDTILKKPRPDLPSLNMRSRFKLEDAAKCVKVC